MLSHTQHWAEITSRPRPCRPPAGYVLIKQLDSPRAQFRLIRTLITHAFSRANPSPKDTGLFCRVPWHAFCSTAGSSPKGPDAVLCTVVCFDWGTWLVRFSRESRSKEVFYQKHSAAGPAVSLTNASTAPPASTHKDIARSSAAACTLALLSPLPYPPIFQPRTLNLLLFVIQ